jgi:hypothetical protein
MSFKVKAIVLENFKYVFVFQFNFIKAGVAKW